MGSFETLVPSNVDLSTVLPPSSTSGFVHGSLIFPCYTLNSAHLFYIACRRVKATKIPVGAGVGDTPDSVVVLMRGVCDL